MQGTTGVIDMLQVRVVDGAQIRTLNTFIGVIGDNTAVGEGRTDDYEIVYCVDANRSVVSGESEYCADGSSFIGTPQEWKVVWFLNNYPPARRHIDSFTTEGGETCSTNPLLCQARVQQAARQALVWRLIHGYTLDPTNPAQKATDTSPAADADVDAAVLAVYNTLWNRIPAEAPAEYGEGEVTLAISPAEATNYLPGGEQHAVTVKLMKGAAPLAGYTVNMSVNGVGALNQSSAVTDQNGEAVFTVTSGVLGTANLQTSAEVPLPVGVRYNVADGTKQPLGMGGYEPVTVTATATKTWISYPPKLTIIKKTNGALATNPNDADVPQLIPGADVVWTYEVTNVGPVAVDGDKITVTDNVFGAVTAIIHKSLNDDNVLDIGETWIYEAKGKAINLVNPTVDPNQELHLVDDACTLDSTIDPSRAYTNRGTVTFPGGEASDTSSYCNPLPKLTIVKKTNGFDANNANGADVPKIAPGDPVEWTYEVTNIGDVDVNFDDIEITDNIPGITENIELDPAQKGNGDDILAPGETWVYVALGSAIDLANPPTGAGLVLVTGVCTEGGTKPPSTAYTNIGTVTFPGDSAYDPSSYCNPPPPVCVPCEDAVTKMTLKLTYRTKYGDRYEHIRVRANDKNGEVLYTSQNDGNGDPGLPVNASFSFNIPSGVQQVVVTVQGDSHRYETVKATFSVTCDLKVGAVDGNSYIKFKVVSADMVDGSICPVGDPLGSIGDYVWKDRDGDGRQDSDEPGVKDVTVKLWNGSGTILIATTATNNDGKYLFSDLPAGAYQVEFVKPDGYQFTQRDSGDDAGDSDADPNTGRTTTIDLSVGEHDRTWDAGLVLQSGCVPCEKGITEMTFKLIYRTHNGDRNERIRVRADDKYGTLLYDSKDSKYDHDYNDPGLPVGAVRTFSVPYWADRVVITVQGKNHYYETVKATFDTDCDLRIGDVDGNSYIKFEIIGAKSKAGPMCSVADLKGSIGDYVWNDLNGNGRQDSGEPGVKDVTVRLLNSNGAVIATDTTDGQGEYLFSGLSAGTYRVEFVKPAGYLFTQRDSGDDAGDSDADPNDGRTATISLPPGKNDLTWDAGLKQQPSCAACEKGITEMTFKLIYRTHSGDRNERIRVHANDKNGEVLYDSKHDHDKSDPGLPVGGVRSFEVPYWATKVVITVQGKDHYHETVKATFSTRCDLRIGAVDGNSYIKFEIIGAESKAGSMCSAGPIGTHSSDHWKNNYNGWTLKEIEVGGRRYDKDTSYLIMLLASSFDKTTLMFEQLAAAKLNIAAGNPSSCIEKTIDEANDWMRRYGPVGRFRWDWEGGGDLARRLYEYNQGLLCAPTANASRASLEVLELNMQDMGLFDGEFLYLPQVQR